MRSLIICLLSFILITITPTFADNVDEAKAAYQNFRYDEALTLFRPMAETGNATAQLYMGIMYSMGRGVEVDRIEAYIWFNLAASQGIEIALYYQTNMREGMSDKNLKEVMDRSLIYYNKFVLPFLDN